MCPSINLRDWCLRETLMGMVLMNGGIFLQVAPANGGHIVCIHIETANGAISYIR